ncbi:MAG: GAF and ANTAR domain-containing protein, partial [bacterium]|nr:GAF and ANTAR domain-containing protein [bacterium]
VEEFDLLEFLHMVTARAAELIGSSAAGLLLADPRGRLQFMAASDERTELLELFQVQTLEGPCQDCFSQGKPVVNADLREASSRWPQFAPRAVSLGFRSVHAFPLRLRREVIGALNLFGSDIGSIGAGDARTVQALADVATIGLLQARAVRRGEVLTEQLQGALNSRIVVEQAKGVIAQAQGCGVDEAFEMLRAYCRTNGLRLSDVAKIVVTTPAEVPVLTTA